MPRRPRPGSIVAVPLAEGRFAFGIVRDEPQIDFLDLESDKPEVSVEEVVTRPVLFRIWVMNKATTTGRWPKLGAAPPLAAPVRLPEFFRQDPVTKEFFIHAPDADTGVTEVRPATRTECIGLERAAVWSAEHVEDRIRDHFDGRPNKWVESLRLPDA